MLQCRITDHTNSATLKSKKQITFPVENHQARLHINYAVFSVPWYRNDMRQSHKRPRAADDDGDGNEEATAVDANSEREQFANEFSVMAPLHYFCPQCFPPPSCDTLRKMKAYSKAMLEKDIARMPLQAQEGLKQMGLRKPTLFHAAVIRGHTECMIRMHNANVGFDFTNHRVVSLAMSFALLAGHSTPMLRLIYQLGHCPLISQLGDLFLSQAADKKDFNALCFLINIGCKPYSWTFRSAATKLNHIAVAVYLGRYRDEFQKENRGGCNREAYRQFLCACLDDCVLFDDPRALHTLANVTGILEHGFDGIGDAQRVLQTLYSTALHQGAVGIVAYACARRDSSLLPQSTQVALTGRRNPTSIVAMGGVLRLRFETVVVMP